MNYTTKVTSYEELIEIYDIADNCFWLFNYRPCRENFQYHYENIAYPVISDIKDKLRLHSLPPHIHYPSIIKLIPYNEFILMLLQ